MKFPKSPDSGEVAIDEDPDFSVTQTHVIWTGHYSFKKF